MGPNPLPVATAVTFSVVPEIEPVIEAALLLAPALRKNQAGATVSLDNASVTKNLYRVSKLLRATRRKKLEVGDKGLRGAVVLRPANAVGRTRRTIVVDVVEKPISGVVSEAREKLQTATDQPGFERCWRVDGERTVEPGCALCEGELIDCGVSATVFGDKKPKAFGLRRADARQLQLPRIIREIAGGNRGRRLGTC